VGDDYPPVEVCVRLYLEFDFAIFTERVRIRISGIEHQFWILIPTDLDPDPADSCGSAEDQF
jgi:hypothetical protein